MQKQQYKLTIQINNTNQLYNSTIHTSRLAFACSTYSFVFVKTRAHHGVLTATTLVLSLARILAALLAPTIIHMGLYAYILRFPLHTAASSCIKSFGLCRPNFLVVTIHVGITLKTTEIVENHTVMQYIDIIHKDIYIKI